MTKIRFVRHTPPHVEPGICYGFSDVDVNGDFDRHLNLIQNRLSGHTPEVVFSSPLIRCQKLAQALYPSMSIAYDDRLKEMNFGDWELQQWDAIAHNALTRWAENLWEYPTPNGEAFGGFYRRVMAFIEMISAAHGGQSITVITHSGVIRCVLMLCLQIPVSHIFNLDLPYSCVVEVDQSPSGLYKVKF